MMRVKTMKSSGFTLVEVLVAVLVLAIGLLGLALLQTSGLRLNTNSYSRSQATLLAYDIIDRMRANAPGFRAGNYDIANATAYNALWSAYTSCKSSTCNCDTGVCDSPTLARYDLGRWYARQYDPTNTTTTPLLPGATAAYTAATPQVATIVRDAPTSSLVTVTIVWYEQDSNGTSQVKTQSWRAEIVQ